jgi:putative spermidine/putrescine transport system substrate-binding protein
MRRRSFLQGSTILLFGQGLLACSAKNQQTLSVELLKGSIPGQVVDKFQQSLQSKIGLNFVPLEQLQDLYQQLQAWRDRPQTTSQKRWGIPLGSSQKKAADLITLGDYWLKTAIEEKLIQPLEIEKLKQWTVLPQRWQEIVTRNEQGLLDARGKVWGAPYRWGTTVIVYRRDKFTRLGWEPVDWSDLWRPELRDRISALDQPREVIGLVLKKLGQSYNTQKIDSIANLEAELRTLKPQVKFYSSTRYLEPLIMGDTWLAIGWSNDVLPVLGRYPQLQAVVPRSGTALWADLWVKPVTGKKDDLIYQWIDFCWLPNIANQISLLTKTNSPIPTPLQKIDIQASLRKILLDNQEMFAKSEFLLPLPSQVTAQYQSLFNTLKE